MKACIVLQNQYGKLGHAIAVNLSRIHGIEKFCAYIYSPDTATFVRNQKDLKYDTILVDHELHDAHKSEIIDNAFIERFEREYFPPNLWYAFYTDRKLMMSIGPKEETTATIDPLYDHETLLKIFQARAKAIESMLLHERPDFILFFAIGSLGHILLYYVARKLGIRTYSIELPRLGPNISLTEDYGRLTGAELISRIGPDEKMLGEAKTRIEHFQKTGSLQLEYYDNFVSDAQKNSRLSKPKRIMRTIGYLSQLFGNYQKNKGLFLYGTTSENPLIFIVRKIRQRYRIIRGYDVFFTDPVPGEAYAYYPLHYEPELATLTMSPFYFEQIELIKYISRSLPLHYKLCVKEHPAMYGKRSRAFYHELLRLPNVRIVSNKYRSIDLIKNAMLITTITGTTGWEACMLEKPVITFGKVFYNKLSFVKHVTDIETLPAVIRKQLDDFRYNKEELLRFTASAIQDSVRINFYALWYENDINKLIRHQHVQLLAKNLFMKTTSPSELL